MRFTRMRVPKLLRAPGLSSTENVHDFLTLGLEVLVC